MATGFLLGMMAMIIGAIVQWRVYETSPWFVEPSHQSFAFSDVILYPAPSVP